MIQLRLQELLKEREKSLYWLAENSGIKYSGLWKLIKDKTHGIQFETLEKICRTLQCSPNDLLVISDNNENNHGGEK